jgi:hypothetical protein
MDPLATVAGAIFTRRHRKEDLARKEREFETTERWELLGRFFLPREIKALRKELADLNDIIDDEQVLRLAEIYAAELWKNAARSVVPDKNAFGTAAQNRFRPILAKAMKERPDFHLYFGPVRYWLVGLPEVDALVTEEFIDRNTRRIMAERGRVAASTAFLSRVNHTSQGVQLVLQHVESALRAEFTLDGSGFGEVMSNSEHIVSLDSAKPGEADWDAYAGLGIGQRLYERAQLLYPGIRWRTRSPSIFAESLRRRLHAQDPYHWEGSCEWCDGNLPLGWEKSTTSSFAGHT